MTEILFHKSKDGSLRQWRTWSDGNTVYTEHGVVGGKLQQSSYVAKATNVGRSNERGPVEQAAFESAALHEFKLTRKYSSTPEEATEELFLPMLAHPIEKAKKVTFPADAQSKLDGVRCIASWKDGKIDLMSRAGLPYIVPHIQKQLELILPKDGVFDGELYKMGLSCQTVTSLVKRQQPRSLELDYNVYDMPVVGGLDNLTWEQRRDAMCARLFTDREVSPELAAATPNIALVDTEIVVSMEEMKAFEQARVAGGYEGAIYRAHSGLYEWGYRSKNLLKVKSFSDGEFEVIGAREGDGKMAGCVIWICKTSDGKEFDASQACTMAERARYWREHTKYIGKLLTVKHFGWTDDGKPRHPVAKLFRSEKDLG